MLDHKLPYEENVNESALKQQSRFAESDFIQAPSRTNEKIDDAELSKEIDTLFSNLNFPDQESEK